MSEKRIFRIDQSALKHSLCMLDFYRIVVLGLRYPINNNDVEFGSALHLFIKVMYETGGDFNQATTRMLTYWRNTKMNVKPEKKYLNEKHLLATAFSYWQSYLSKDDFEVLSLDGKPAVEITFSNKYYEDDEFIVYLEGTIDKIGKIKNGCYAIGDYKTTSAYKREEFLDSFELKTQGRFYLFNLRLFAELNPDSKIAEIARSQIGFFIDAIFLNGASKTEFERSRVYQFKDEDMKVYGFMLSSFITRFLCQVKNCTHLNVTPRPEGLLNDACSANFGCTFTKLCSAPDDLSRELLVNRDYVIKPYEPLKHGKE